VGAFVGALAPQPIGLCGAVTTLYKGSCWQRGGGGPTQKRSAEFYKKGKSIVLQNSFGAWRG